VIVSNAEIESSKLVYILLGLMSIFTFIFLLNIEESLELVKFFALVLGSFALYLLTPLSYRLPLLFALTLLSFFAFFELFDALLLIGLGLLLFGVVNLNYSLRVRSILLLLISLLLGLFRLSLLPFLHQEVIIPVIGGLFMFRSILYLYEARFVNTPANIWLRLNYFFLLPNLIFLIFPVVDYKTFINNYYSKPAYETYFKGVLWMANGVFHLFLYRLIYYYLLPDPKEILNVFTWLQFVVASYALIVRLAGIFHFSVGVICLFGFDLPPTFHHYFFANSFSDLWRRINVYWRDFVMKVFYYPIYFQVKKAGIIKAIVISILLTFVINWLLHAYQWFWIKGTLLFTLQDITFWGIFGLAVALNAVYQIKHKGNQKQEEYSLSAAAANSLKVIGVFGFMAFLWSWWTSPSVAAWLELLSVWKKVSSSDFLILGFGLVVLLFAGIVIDFLYTRYLFWKKSAFPRPSTQLIIISCSLLLIASIGLVPVHNHLEDWSGLQLDPVIRTALNAADADAQFQGYYETILVENSLLDSPLANFEAKRPKNWGKLHETGAQESVAGILSKRLKPNVDILFKGERFMTNSFGLRDLPVEQESPDNRLRIALLGGSIEMGGGVKVTETYENVLTDYLNEEALFTPYQQTEILNFGISGTHLFQHLARLEQVVAPFKPEVVVYTAHSDEIRRVMSNIYRLYQSGTEIPYPYLAEFMNSLPEDVLKSEFSFHRAIDEHKWDIMSYGLSLIKDQTVAIGAVPVWMFVPALDGREKPAENDQLFQLADSLQFQIIDLRGYYDEDGRERLFLRPWDTHPSVMGHQRIAQKALQAIKSKPELIKAIIRKYPQE
jgi:hypothetical protein